MKIRISDFCFLDLILFPQKERKKWKIETKKVFPREDRKWKHAAEEILNTRFCQNAQPRSDDRSLLHNRIAPPPLCPAPHTLVPGVHAHVQHLLPLLWPPDQPLTAASAGQGKTMWACGYPQCSLQVIIKPLHLVTMRWIKSTKMNPPGLRRRAVLLCFLARSNWSSVGGWREIQNFFKRLICKRLFRWYMFQKQMTFFG